MILGMLKRRCDKRYHMRRLNLDIIYLKIYSQFLKFGCKVLIFKFLKLQ